MDTETDFDKALKDPSAVYHSPFDVLQDKNLNDEQRLRILQQWEQDERELEVAQEEGMSGGENSILDEILNAMEKLGSPDNTPDAPIKHGGPVT